MREGPGIGSRRAREVRKGRTGETQAGAGGRARQPAPQPTGHSRPPKGKGNVMSGKESKKREAKKPCSLSGKHPTLQLGNILLNAVHRPEG